MPPYQRLAALSQKYAEKPLTGPKESVCLFWTGYRFTMWRFFWRSIVDGALTTRASAIAFNFFLALFPAILFLFTLIPYIPIPNFQDELFT